MELEGRVALVTGSAKRVGRAIATELARRGARVAIHYNRSRDEALGLAKELKASRGTEAELFRADLSRTRDAERLGRDVIRKMGSVDVLVNSASTYYRRPFGTVTERDWDGLVDVNLKAPFFLSQVVGPHMKKRGRGKIVNIADWSALRPYAAYMPYCCAKAGLVCLTIALAKTLGPEVQVNAVLPGPVLLPPDVGEREREAIRQATLTKKLGRPEDVAAAVAFLVEGSDFITGATLAVDGGRLVA